MADDCLCGHPDVHHEECWRSIHGVRFSLDFFDKTPDLLAELLAEGGERVWHCVTCYDDCPLGAASDTGGPT